VDIPGQINVTTSEEDVEPVLEFTPELVQKRRSQARIIFDRFIRNKAGPRRSGCLDTHVSLLFSRTDSLQAQSARCHPPG